MIGTAATLLFLATQSLDPADVLAHWERAAEAAPADYRPLLPLARALAAAGRPAAADAAVERAADLSRVILTDTPPPAPAAAPVPAGGIFPWPPAAAATPKPPPLPLTRPDLLTGLLTPVGHTAPAAAPPPAAPPRLVEWLPDDVLAARTDRHTAAGRWVEAEAGYAVLGHRRPADPSPRVARGRALLAVFRYDDAEAAFADAARLAPTDPAAPAGVGYARAAAGRPTNGLLETAHPLARAGRAHVLAKARDAAGAATAAAEALAAEPRSLDLLLLFARAEVAAGRGTAAVAAVALAESLPVPLDAPARATLRGLRAAAWLNAGCPPAADRDARAALALDPANPDPLDVLARAAEARADYPAAVEHYADLVRRQPHHAGARGRLAVLKAVGPDLAVRDPDGAAELADGLPAGPQRHAVLAMAHAAAGRYGRAVIAVNAALSTDPPADDVPQLEAMRAAYLQDRPWPDGD